jgi:outer membrane protein assembly factor BamB
VIQPRRPLALFAATLLGLGLAGCGTLDRVASLNPFNRGGGNKVIATRGERIPLVAFNQQVSVAENLRGTSFFLPDPVAVESWPQPSGTPNAWTDNVAAGASFQVGWSARIGEESDNKHYITATPVVAEGKVFTMDAEAQVSAFDAATGRELWRVDAAARAPRDNEGFGGGLAYEGGRLYVTSGFRAVQALNPANGSVVWRTRTLAPVHDAPAAGGGRVFAVDLDNQFQSYDAATGRPDWSYQALTEPARILKATAPVITGDAVVGAFGSGELVAFRMTNGNVLWNQTLSRGNQTNALSEIRSIAGRPVVAGGDVYAGSHSGVFAAVDLRTGAPRWTLPVATITTPWPAGEVVYVVSRAGEVICASRATGQVYWIADLNKGIAKAKDRSLYFGPILASGRLLVGGSNGYVIALDPRTGAQTGRIEVNGPILMAPIAAAGHVYVVTDEGTLVAIR